MNRPFQFVVGIQSSALMLESGVGLTTIFTRQCSGIGSLASGGRPAGPGPPPAAPRGPPGSPRRRVSGPRGTSRPRALSRGGGAAAWGEREAEDSEHR